ncbi:MAG: hypothetical protein R3C13_06925 [Hyphomonas sp.]|uniref:hypothetical protein n=1 Tax=Hyphomonas sp. TaxID=87 RepID=UPI003529918B
MLRQMNRPAGLALAGLCLMPVLAACATGPQIRVAKAPGANEPIAVVAAVVPEEGPKTNQWGGVIPDAKPSTPVDDGGLGEIGN